MAQIQEGEVMQENPWVSFLSEHGIRWKEFSKHRYFLGQHFFVVPQIFNWIQNYFEISPALMCEHC